MAAAVLAEQVGKDYGAVCAVSDLTFEVAAGDVVGVLGRNGAGKTTSIRVLTTIVAPTRGRFAVAGVPHTRPDEIRRRIGVLPEGGGYPGRQTGEEHLVFHARLHGASRVSAKAAAAALLEEFGLADRARTPLHAYSLGMRRRLGIARALVNDPAVVFLDEPTLGLDPAGRRAVLDHVRAVAAGRGAAVLLSTHLLDDVEACCSRVLILHHGRTVAAGTVAEVVRLAAGPRSAVILVSPEDAARAASALAVTAGVGRVQESPDRPGELRADLAAGNGQPDPAAALRALLDAGIAPLGLDVEGARLSDAFLEMTGGGMTAERAAPGWWIVLEQELRDVWLGGRGPALTFAFSLILSAVAYLVATNTALNFLEQREAVGLVVQVSVAMGGVLVVIAAADGVSGERDRGTLETLLLAPVPRRHIAAGKLGAALSLWPAAFLVALPYVWFLGRGVDVVGDAVVVGLLVGTLLALELGALGVVLSLFAGSNRVSLALSLFVLLALFAPTQLSAGAQQGWAGDLMLRANPLTAGVHYVGRVLVDGHSLGRDIDLLVAPAVAAIVLAALALAASGRMSLRPGGAP